MSDLHGRYAGLSHQALYDMVMAGKPAQVRLVGAAWNRLRTDMNNLASAVDADLRGLFRTWSSPAGEEYRDRVGSIVTFANLVAGEFGSVETSLNLMAGPLEHAIATSDSPAETDDHDSMVDGALRGASTGAAGGPAGAVAGLVVGATFGHQQDEEEKKRAHQQMIDVVANLAADYNVTVDTQMPTDPAPPPGNLPYSSSSSMAPISQSGTSATSHGVSSTGTGLPPGSTDLATISPRSGPVPAAFDPSQVTGLAAGPSLTEVSSGPGGGGSGIPGGALLGGAAAVGAGGLAAAARGFAAGRSGSNNASGPGAGGTTGAASAGPSSRPSTGLAEGVLGREDRSAAMSRSAGANGATGTANNRSGMAGRGGGFDDEGDERETWLTEDDMDWGDADAAPPVLGSPGTTDPGLAEVPEQPVEGPETSLTTPARH